MTDQHCFFFFYTWPRRQHRGADQKPKEFPRLQRARRKWPRRQHQPIPSSTCPMTKQKTSWIHGWTNSQGRRLVDCRWNHVVDLHTEQDRVKQAWTKLITNWNPAISTKQKGEARPTGQEIGRRHQFRLTTNQSPQRRQRSHERHDFAHQCTRWHDTELHGKRLCEQQTQTTNTTHDSDRHDKGIQANIAGQTIHATKAQDHDEDGADNYSKVDLQPKQPQSTNKRSKENSAPAAPHVFFQRRYRPTSSQVARGLSRHIWTDWFCTA